MARSGFDTDRQRGRIAAKALRAGLEKYDRSQGVWRGTRKVIATDKLGSEADWRAALSEAEVPRAIAEALRTGRLGVMDYYNLENIQSDTRMRGNIANATDDPDNDS